MPKVYIPHVPSRWSTSANCWVKTVDMTQAKRFGELIEVLQPDAYRMAIPHLVPAMKHQMRDYGADDYLVAVGDPSLTVTAALIAAKKTGGLLHLLKWDRMLKDYIELEITV